MARAFNKTAVYEIRAAHASTSLFVAERAGVKIQKIGATRTRRTDLRSTAKDASGRTFERISGWHFRCVATGEIFSIVEQAPSLRKVTASGA
jgi:hypothetical protein